MDPDESNRAHRVVALLLSMMLGLAACTGDQPSPPKPTSDGSGGPSGGATLAVVPEVVDRLSPSVVTIRTGKGLGSGVVYRPDGLIVTNAHVVQGSSTVTVVFADGSSTKASVLATDKITDLAVVRVERDGLPAPKYADTLPQVGELAIAIGTPLGFETTVTVGVVSGVGREIPGAVTRGQKALVNLIQTDAAISPGSSGGALVNGSGTVIGINDAYLPPKTGAVSIGFAIPATTVTYIVDQLLADGSAEHPYLGVTLATLTPALRKALGISAQQGVVVREVVDGSPAARADLRPGDVIVRFAGDGVTSVASLLGALRSTRPGEQVPMTVARGGGKVELTVTIGERPS